MDERLETIQQEYIRELKKELPKINKWWKARSTKNEEKSYPDHIVLDFEARWPTGMSGHPRLIAIFRKYYLMAEAINVELDVSGREYREENVAEPWGTDTSPPTRGYMPPIELLIDDLKGNNDDLHRVMRRLRLIPIGMKDGEVV